MPAYVLYGDGFLASEALGELRAQVGPPEVREANSHRLSKDEFTVEGLGAVVNALPFLAQSRLVVVEGLLGSAEARDGRRPGGKGSSGRGPKWEGLAELVEAMPPTTLLVFLDGPLRSNNSLLGRLKAQAQVRNFPAPRGEELSRWTRQRAEAKGSGITPGGLRLLGQYIGGNLRVLDSELEKLSLYAPGRPIGEEDIKALVPQVREASIFAAVDAILEGRLAVGLRLLHRLREGGANLSYILAMVARQLRLVALAKDLLLDGVSPADIGSRLEIRADFAAKKTVDQARRSEWSRIRALYQRLLDTDLAVKEGRLEEDLALELLVAGSAPPR